MTHIIESEDRHETKLIEHLGIVAGICKESGLAELIDERVEQPKRHVTVGQATVTKILNALGFSGRALYLTKRFFVNRPVDQLIAPHIKAEDLHDYSLGTALDAIYEHGITELFSTVAVSVLAANGISTRDGLGVLHPRESRELRRSAVGEPSAGNTEGSNHALSGP